MIAIDAATCVAIATMAGATYLTRVGGFWVMSHIPPSPRVRRILEALPGAVVMATVVPLVAREGLPAILAIAAAGLAMVVRRNDLLAVLAGMAAAAAARSAGL
jgi:uncharacterized membrane protein